MTNVNLDLVHKNYHLKRVHDIMYSDLSTENKLSAVRSLRPEFLDTDDLCMWIEKSDPQEVQRFILWSECFYKWNKKRTRIMKYVLSPFFKLGNVVCEFLYDEYLITFGLREAYYDLAVFVVTLGDKPLHPEYLYEVYGLEREDTWGPYSVYDRYSFPKSRDYLIASVEHKNTTEILLDF